MGLKEGGGGGGGGGLDRGFAVTYEKTVLETFVDNKNFSGCVFSIKQESLLGFAKLRKTSI